MLHITFKRKPDCARMRFVERFILKGIRTPISGLVVETALVAKHGGGSRWSLGPSLVCNALGAALVRARSTSKPHHTMFLMAIALMA